MTFYLVTWKEFEKMKMINKSEVVKTDNIDDAMKRIKSLNAQKRLTTTDYSSHNLSEIFEAQGIELNKSEE